MIANSFEIHWTGNKNAIKAPMHAPKSPNPITGNNGFLSINLFLMCIIVETSAIGRKNMRFIP